ncbi:SDR family NAD(P)-dependent oxidoreductase [Rubrobacter aplysinae]|uniref:SDR family NAD(P)-dependent oxidoreductase n=1 Tax=Rubrobacter aplysinae TaxID=909625 RepID=UPI00064BEEBB|nr:glucose 1-dehydrogenase [Rubrobacter aplysinae]
MDGKNGLVTASGSGIGRASALTFAREGARVLVSDVADEAGEETVRQIRAAGGEAEYLHADVSREEDVAALVGRVVELWGSLDFAHNHAGISSENKPITEQETSAWRKVLDINILGTANGMKYELDRMHEQGTGGAVVNTSSMAGLSGTPGMTPYITSKWGIIGMSQSAAMEFAPEGIRVNVICPGLTVTASLEKWSEESPEAYAQYLEGIPMKKGGEAQDQADAAVWLCSEKSKYITGVALPISGGSQILG